MTNNKQRSAVIRQHMDDNPGTSFTKASFAVRDAQAAAAEAAAIAAPKPERPDLSNLYGHLVVAKAPKRRTRHGLLLPPAPGTRSTLPRIQPEGEDTPVRFDPLGYEVTPVYGPAALNRTYEGRPIYRYAELPGKTMLATETMLRDELRRRPRDGATPLAWFHSLQGKDYFPLYATADTVALPELSPKRAAAWTATRTCANCGKSNPTPFPNRLSNTVRYCTDCWPDARREDWTARQRPIQLQQAEWARGVLADASVVLVGVEQSQRVLVRAQFIGVTRMRVESFAGEVLMDVRTLSRAADDLDPHEPKLAELLAQVTPRDEIDRAVAALAGHRLITWTSSRPLGVDDGRAHLPVAEGDHIQSRYACWLARISYYSSGTTNQPARLVEMKQPHGDVSRYTTFERDKLTAEGQIEFARECIRETATEPLAPVYERAR